MLALAEGVSTRLAGSVPHWQCGGAGTGEVHHTTTPQPPQFNAGTHAACTSPPTILTHRRDCRGVGGRRHTPRGTCHASRGLDTTSSGIRGRKNPLSSGGGGGGRRPPAQGGRCPGLTHPPPALPTHPPPVFFQLLPIMARLRSVLEININSDLQRYYRRRSHLCPVCRNLVLPAAGLRCLLPPLTTSTFLPNIYPQVITLHRSCKVTMLA